MTYEIISNTQIRETMSDTEYARACAEGDLFGDIIPRERVIELGNEGGDIVVNVYHLIYISVLRGNFDAAKAYADAIKKWQDKAKLTA